MRPAFPVLLLSICALFVCSSVSGQTGSGQSPASNQNQFSLSFQQRVYYQRAIEEVYWKHTLWPEQNPTPKPPLDQVISFDTTRSKVEDYLRKSNALAEIWQRPITPKQLQAEMDRMARNTKRPGVLAELFAALDNNPLVIAECLARPALADRLIRNWYAYDSRFHGELHDRARSELLRFGAVGLMHNLSGQYSEIEWIRKDESSPDLIHNENAVALDPETWKNWNNQLADQFSSVASLTPQREVSVGILSPLQESESDFSVTSVLSKQDGRIKIAIVQWKKEPFDSWWPQQSQQLTDQVAMAPALFGNPMIPSTPCADDTWTPVSYYLPGNRAYHTAVWTGSLMVVWGGQDASSAMNTGGRYDPSTDTWSPTSITGAPGPRHSHTAVWTGSEMIVWGGNTNTSLLDTGGRYNPSTDTWTATSTTGVPSARWNHTAVWTGSKMIVWGGNDGTMQNTGGRYDPSGNTWTATSTIGAPSARDYHTAVWTGSRMIVWGGAGGVDTGGRYDESTDSWTTTSTVSAPSGRYQFTAVWTGTVMVVWGGIGGANTGGRYNPATDTWVATNTNGAPSGREWHSAVWTGSEMIIWGGFDGSSLNTGGRYNPLSDTWIATSTSASPSARQFHTAVWTGSEMIVWGGRTGSNYMDTGGRYDPVTDTWTATATSIAPAGRYYSTTVWTGTEMIVWSGQNPTYLNTGGRYNPSTDTWSAMTTTDAPSPRNGAASVWTGTRMVVWGGNDNLSRLNTGGQYDPLNNTWTATSNSGAPSARQIASAIWTGSVVVVWGGENYGSFFNTGGRYNPADDTWSSTSTNGAPSVRAGHTAVWTGSRMVVWGGYAYGARTNTGGQYDPSNDNWTTMTTSGAPTARDQHTAAWTGTRMIVWGGYDGSSGRDDGGVYDPSNDSWSAMSSSGTPSPRWAHTAVWTGTEMIVWGGYTGSSDMNSGGRYDPSSNSWSATSTAGAPSPRYLHLSVWTGSSMLVWGGYDDVSGAFNTGGRYVPSCPRLSIDDVNVTEGNSGTTNATFTVSLSASSDVPVTVHYSTTDGDATAPLDFAAISDSVLTFPAYDNTPQSVTVEVVGETLDEYDEHFFVNLSNATNAEITDNQGQGRISNDDSPPSVSINDAVISEGNSPDTALLSFNISLTTVSGKSVYISYSTADGTATSTGTPNQDKDYLSASVPLMILPGVTTRTASITVYGDNLNEPDETFSVNLFDAGNVLIDRGQATGTILNDDPPAAVVDTIPSPNALDVAANAIISATFNQDMEASTFDNSTIRVRGSLSGLHASSNINYDSGTHTVTFDPDANFTVGEMISVTLMPEIHNIAGMPIASYGWSFTVAAPSGYAAFYVMPSAQSAQTGAMPLEIGSADFNDDGDLDLAVANYNDGTVSILINDGAAVFSEAQSVTVGGHPEGIVVGDFDNDGDADVAVSKDDLGANNVSILTNDSGTFNLASSVTTGARPLSMAAGDLDGDGDLDLVTSNYGSRSFSVLKNDGSGTFVWTSSSPIGDTPRVPSLGDVDADGDLDLVLPINSTNIICVFKNDGSGAFPQMSSFGTGGVHPTGSTLGDFDRDGDLDVAVSNSSTSTVAILKNSGSGSLVLSTPIAVPAGPALIANGDFDADGDLDLAVVNGQSNAVSILTNDGDASFALRSSRPVADWPFGVCSGDFDGDGDLDLAATRSNADRVDILLNQAPQVLVDGVTTDESSGMIFMRVHIRTADLEPLTQDVVLNYSTIDGSAVGGQDYGVAAGSLTFPAGTPNEQTLDIYPLTILDDNIDEPQEDFTVSLTMVSGGELAWPSSTVEINDDDPTPSITINDVVHPEGNSGQTNFDFTVSLSNPSAYTITVDYSTSDGSANDGSDYVGKIGTLTFDPGVVSQPITVMVNGDTLEEFDEDFLVDLSNPTNASIADGQGRGVILTDDGFAVTNTNDSGPGSLREAIFRSNANNLGDVISFNLPGAGVHTITPVTPLPALSSGNILDGLTQPGSSATTPLIELSGAAGVANGVTIVAGYNTVRGLVINGFSNAGVLLSGAGVTNNVVVSNRIGTNAAGTMAVPNGTGIVLAAGALDNTIGGPRTLGNLIDGTTGGVRMTDSNTSGNRILGNTITTPDAGFAPLSLKQASRLVTAHVTSEPDWMPEDRRHSAMFERMQKRSENRTNALASITTDSPLAPVPTGYGILLENGTTGNIIGGTGPGEGNTIQNNGGSGVIIKGATTDRNSILRNSIDNNGYLGIDLGEDGVTLNDAGDLDNGPNEGMNYPAITKATTSGGSSVIEGSIDTPTLLPITIELFVSNQPDPSGNGEGNTYLASATPNGFGVFSVSTVAIPVGSWVTATATDTAGNTSEFAAAAQVQGATAPATALVAVVESTSAIRLKWTDPQSNETGFRLERSLNGISWSAFDSVGPNDTTYLDTGRSPATPYYYRVIAYSMAGDAAPSNIAVATTFSAVARTVCATKVGPQHSWARQISVAHNGAQWAAAWQERGDDANDEIFFGLLRQSDGTLSGDPVPITNNDMMSQYPVLRWNGNNFGLLWSENMRGPNGQLTSKLNFALLDANGNTLRSSVRILEPEITGAINTDAELELVWDGAGWGIFSILSSNPPLDLYYYRLTEDGDVVTGPVQITNTPDFEYDVTAIWDGSEYGLSWVRQRDNNYDVYFQRMQANGSLIGSPALVWHNPSGNGAYTPSVVRNASGWAVAWWDIDADGYEVAYLRLLDAAGSPLGDAVRISDDSDETNGIYDELPLLFNKPGGGYILYTSTYSDSAGVYEIGRLEADANGNRSGSRTLLTPADGHHSDFQKVATDGTNFLVAYNDETNGTQEVADLIVDASGVQVAAPNALTSGHTSGTSGFFTTSGAPVVAALRDSFVTLWNEPVVNGSLISGKIFHGLGGATDLSPLSSVSLRGRPAMVAAADTFAVAWKDTSNNVVFNRYDSSGNPVMMPEAVIASNAGGRPNVGLDFSGEVYGVVWANGNGQIRFQRVLPDGTLLGSATMFTTNIQPPGPQVQWVGSGWAIVWKTAGDLYYARLTPAGAVAIPPTQLTFNRSVSNQYQLLWNGTSLGLMWMAYIPTADPPGQDIWFTVLNTDGNKLFPAKAVVTTPYSEFNPSLYWDFDRFRLVYQQGTVDGLWEMQILPDGTITGEPRMLSNRGGQNAVAWNGATLGVLWVQLRDMFFETTECLKDTTAPPCPNVTLLSNAQGVDLDWGPSGDPESGLYRYNIYRDGLALAELSPDTLSYSDTGFENGPNFYQVRALNSAYLESTGCPSLAFNCPTITISPDLPMGTVGVPYNQTLSASGGAGPYTFALTWGNLAALELSSDGVISGTPSQTNNLNFTITATDSNGCTGSRTYFVRIISLRPATSLTATALSSSSIRLNWTDPQSTETSFQLERSLNGTTWAPFDVVGPNTTTYTDVGRSAGTLYYYRVTARNASESAASNIAVATTFPSVAAKICATKVSPDHTWARYPSVARSSTQWAMAYNERVSETNDEIFFRLVNNDGTFAAPAVRITNNDTMSQLPALRWNGSHFGLLWFEHMRGPNGEWRSKPFFSLLDSTGAKIRSDVRIPEPDRIDWLNYDGEPELVWDGTGWGVFLSLGSSSLTDIFYYRLDESGSVLTGPVQLTNTPDYEYEVTAAWNGAEYGLSWVQHRDNNWDLYFQRMQVDGTLIGDPVFIWHNASGNGLYSSSLLWNSTRWALAWWEIDADFYEPAYLRLLDASGNPLSAAVRISDNEDQTHGIYDEMPLLFSKTGGGYFLYTSSYMEDTGAYEIARLEADADGHRFGSRVLLTTNDGYNSIYNRMATDGTNFLVAYNEESTGTQELADMILDASGAVVGTPNILTTGHSPGMNGDTTTSTSPNVISLGNGFVTLWNEWTASGSRIYSKIFNGSGGVVTLSPLSTHSLVGRPAAVATGSTFAVAWKDSANNVVFGRYNASGGPVISEVTVATNTGGRPNVSMDFSGEAYGLAWAQGNNQIGFRRVAPDGALLGSTTLVNFFIQPPGPLVQWIGSGWAIVWKTGGNLYYMRLTPSGDVDVSPIQVTFSGGVRNQYQLLWNGSSLGLAWTDSSVTAVPPGNDVWFTVLNTDGIKAFPARAVVSTDFDDAQPALYWSLDRFRLVFQKGDSDGLWEIQLLPDGTITGSMRMLTNRGSQNAVAWNGKTLGVLWTQRRDMFFQTTECLNDSTAPTCPSGSLSFDGAKVTLNWTASTDSQSGILNYSLYRNGLMLAEPSATTLSYDDYGFESGPSAYQIRAVNGAYLESTNCTSLLRNCPAITVSTALPNGTISAAYSTNILASGGDSPYTFTVASGALPPGLVLSPVGLLAGTPTALGDFSFTIRATDSHGCTGIRAYIVHIGSASCFLPDERLYLYSVVKDSNDNPVLNFEDPNQPSQVTGYNIYRATESTGPWTLVGSDVVDMDEGAANKQWVDHSGASETFYYQVAAFNNACPAEGPW